MASSRTIRVSQYKKGRTILDFIEARDDGMAVASAGPYADHHWHHQLWGTGACAPSIFNNLFFQFTLELHKV